MIFSFLFFVLNVINKNCLLLDYKFDCKIKEKRKWESGLFGKTEWIIQSKCVYLHRNDAKTTHSDTTAVLPDGAKSHGTASMQRAAI